MSRYVQNTPHLEKGHELYRKENRTNKVLILRNHGILYSFLLRDNRIYKVAREEKDDFPIGTILIGKVVNVAKQLNSAFVQLENTRNGKAAVGYLPIKNRNFICPLNRKPDGRLLNGDEVLVQVTKAAQKTKPPQLTAELSLAGQFVVVQKGGGQGNCFQKPAYSRKLIAEEKMRLQEAFGQWLEKVRAEGELEESLFQDIHITFRTNAAFVEKEIWGKELADLSGQLKRIDQISQNRTAYSILRKPEAFYLDFLKDIAIPSLEEVVTDDKKVYEELKSHPLSTLFPVRFYEDDRISLQNVYALSTHIHDLLSAKVYMKSGAYLMIEPTEALVSIDVNTGKAEKKTEPEEFYFRTNLEAVKEVCYQLSARNLSGMILVDFINMKEREHVKQLLDALTTETAKDSVPTCFIDYTRLGLAELTRKKTSRTLRDIMRDWKF